MEIELIKLKINDTHSYKYKPFTYCCDEIQKDKTIVFTCEDINDIGGEYEDDGVCVPQFCTSYTETVGSWETNGSKQTIIRFSFVLIVAKRLRFQL